MYNGEKIIGSWVTNFITAGLRATGNLIVTEEAVYFIPTTVIMGSISKAGDLFQETEGGYICRFAPQDIVSATSKSKLLNKRIVMQVKNLKGLEQEAVIDNGALSLKSIISAMSKITKVHGAV